MEGAPTPVLECLETAGVNPAQRGVAEASPICSEEQDLLLVYSRQMRASCLLSTCVLLRRKPRLRNDDLGSGSLLKSRVDTQNRSKSARFTGRAHSRNCFHRRVFSHTLCHQTRTLIVSKATVSPTFQGLTTCSPRN